MTMHLTVRRVNMENSLTLPNLELVRDNALGAYRSKYGKLINFPNLRSCVKLHLTVRQEQMENLLTFQVGVIVHSFETRSLFYRRVWTRSFQK